MEHESHCLIENYRYRPPLSFFSSVNRLKGIVVEPEFFVVCLCLFFGSLTVQKSLTLLTRLMDTVLSNLCKMHNSKTKDCALTRTSLYKS